ncbi:MULTISPECIES: MarR family winged helix-turn-helix transcriptional regulator [unclassified Mesorhizobium]|uniref:MarR family winged helix-turn-helix transcriptional regulator n=1 Tax=unclassified Mesorhizobium TaxID=325217 RepID=UPI000FD875B7|nr:MULTISPECIES: MarR family winged helix-turn-helix transcriptional regulator [unclassified Mesorhizobium]TGQ44595.1 MarR family transcriptional regulator [Mesorhizobium sp. M00.F.Ca.ET.216.01.1.1]TIS57947.1 MAG: MarR family transcriptional regulator [Mesorhizobium sp.]TIS92487.1 MAG: MarR family transcriptional regulator [Mesorhizobium sp.]TJW44730.1 MAG: MarR family transcriptional regulator [Mesorhizobium sp.]
MSIVLRPSQALRLWQQVMLSQVREGVPDLTMRQTAILFTIYLDPPPHTVRGLAGRLNVTKPVITRALDTMGALKLVSRHRDELDKRNVLIRRTVEGALFVERFGDVIIAQAQELPI